MIQDTNYSIGDATFAITYSDIPSVSADAIVSSDDNYLSMGGGVSEAIARAAGSALRTDARKHIPLSLGDVAVTSAGNLAAKYVFHGVTIDLTRITFADTDTIRLITHKCLDVAVALGVREIAFPALGTGSARVPAEPCAEAMTREIASFLSEEPRTLTRVNLALFARPYVPMKKIETFYAKVAELAIQWTGSRRLGALVNELEILLPNDQANADLRMDLRRLRAALSSAEGHLNSSPSDITAVTRLEQQAGLGELSRSAETVIARSEEVVDWEDVQAQNKILQARLESLRTQENATYGNRNRLEEQKSSYAPAEVPLHLLNAIDGVEAELRRIGTEISEVKSKLAALSHSPGVDSSTSQ
jgi:O-acetyl-ADP-ribose deacetylase (regulator of RNase III)